MWDGVGRGALGVVSFVETVVVVCLTLLCCNLLDIFICNASLVRKL